MTPSRAITYPLLPRQAHVRCRDSAGVMRRERDPNLRVADVDVGMMVSSFGSLGDSSNEIDTGQKTPKLESLRDHVTPPAPARETTQLALYSNVG